jgi:hypothetical protein
VTDTIFRVTLAAMCVAVSAFCLCASVFVMYRQLTGASIENALGLLLTGVTLGVTSGSTGRALWLSRASRCCLAAHNHDNQSYRPAVAKGPSLDDLTN